MTVAVRTTVLSVTVDGVALPNVFSARISYGFDQPVSEARIVCANVPAGPAAYDDAVIIKMGVSGSGNETAARFTGYWKNTDYSLFPRSVTLVCKGPLSRANEKENWASGASTEFEEQGLDVKDLTGSDSAADEAIVKAVLTRIGVSYTAGNIGGTGRSLADSNPEQFLWRTGFSDISAVNLYSGAGQSALDYILGIDAISAVDDAISGVQGFYRTFDSISTIYRALIGGRPRSTADFTFTEGVDIAEGSAGRGIADLKNAVLVHGYDDGAGAGPAEYFLQNSNPFQTALDPHVYTFSSPLIEWDDEAMVASDGGGKGMSCETVANALMAEVNREVVNVRLRTPLDYLIGPGQTHLVQGPGGAPDRLGTGEKLWVRHVDIEVDEQGRFSQSLDYIGGGLPDIYLPSVPFG